MSGTVRLRDATPADNAFVESLFAPEVAGEFNSFDDPDEEVLRGVDVQAERMIVELMDGTPIGDVTYFGVPYGPNKRSLAWKIGITILPEHRGRGHGADAQRLIAENLFATTVTNRIEADTDVENIAEQHALTRAGFAREGILRGAQYRQGRWHDLVMYSRLRDVDDLGGGELE